MRERRELVADLTLVAEDDGRVVGHIALSEVTLDGQAVRGLGLAPVAVAPNVQQSGVGSLLITTALERAEHNGWHFVVLLGQTTRRLSAYLDPQSTATTFVSEFNFDRVGSVPVTVPVFDPETETYYNPSDPYCGAPISYPASQTVDGNYGGCGVDDTGARYVRRAAVFGWTAGNLMHRLFMQAPRDSPADQCAVDNRCLASWVRVYHPDANTWILSPEPFNEVGDGWDGLKPLAVHTQYSPRTGQQPQEVVELPFRIVVTRK